MPCFGKQTDCDGDEGGQNFTAANDRIYLLKATLSEDGNVTRISFYGRSVSGNNYMQCAIYDDDGGEPDARQGVTNEVLVSTNLQWWDFTCDIDLTAGTYWIGWNQKTEGSSPRYYFDSVSGAARYKSGMEYDDGFPASMPSMSNLDKELSIFAEYTTGGATYTKTFTGDAFLEATQTKTLTTDAYLLKEYLKTFAADAILQSTVGKSFTADAILKLTATKTATIDAFLRQVYTKTFAADAILKATYTKTFDVDAVLSTPDTKTFDVDAFLEATKTKTLAADAYLQKPYTKTLTIDAYIQQALTKTLTVDAYLQAPQAASFAIDAYLQATQTKTFSIDAIITAVATHTKTFTIDAFLQASLTKTFSVDAIVGVAAPPSEVSIWLEPKRKRRLPLPRDTLEAIQEYLELKVQQNV